MLSVHCYYICLYIIIYNCNYLVAWPVWLPDQKVKWKELFSQWNSDSDHLTPVQPVKSIVIAFITGCRTSNGSFSYDIVPHGTAWQGKPGKT